MGLLRAKLRERRIWERIFRERLSEPLHLNLLSLPVALFGGFRAKVYFDLVVRQQHAFCLLRAADQALAIGHRRISVVEFGVAQGAGLMNICDISQRITRETGVAFDIFGFDTGKGMPPPVDWRDHPESYFEGDFAMQHDRLAARLPDNCRLVIGELADTVPGFGDSLPSPLGFVSIDVDYYSSTSQALRLLGETAPEHLLPVVPCYFDDIFFDQHNRWSGELLAIEEFNAAHAMRKIDRFTFLAKKRLFRNAQWIDQVFALHALDHPWRSPGMHAATNRVLTNPYLD